MTQDRFSPVEFIAVIGVAFGAGLLGSFQDVLVGRIVWDDGGWAFGTEGNYLLVLSELLVLPGLAAILYFGGWRLKDFPVAPAWRTTLIGVVIAVGMYAVDWILAYYLKGVFPELRTFFDLVDGYKAHEPPSIASIVLLCLVNPLFEEIFVCGYVVQALRGRFGERIAVAASVVIRAGYHLYQGIALLPSHAAYGIIQACVFVKYGSLWPLIVSHVVSNAYGGIVLRF